MPYRSRTTGRTVSAPDGSGLSIPYTGAALLDLLLWALADFWPDALVMPHLRDAHPDHHALARFTLLALHWAQGDAPAPDLLAYIVWPGGLRRDPARSDGGAASWERLSLTPEAREQKAIALRCYRSQALPVWFLLRRRASCTVEIFARLRPSAVVDKRQQHTMKRHLKRSLPWLITTLLAVFLIRQGGNWRDLRAVLGRAGWSWLLLALVFQAASYGAVAWLNELLLRHYGALVPWPRQYVIQLAMAFVEAAIPSATVSGFVLRARLLRPYGVTPDVATVTAMIEIVLITSSVFLFALLAGGLAVMSGVGGLGMIQWPLTWLLGGAVLLGAAVWLWRRGQSGRVGEQIVGRLGWTWDHSIVRRWPERLADWPAARLLN